MSEHKKSLHSSSLPARAGLALAALISPLMLPAQEAAAADDSARVPAGPTEELMPLVVTGEVYAFGAQKIVNVTDEDLSLMQANSLHDIFSQDPSIKVGGGLPAAQKIYIRGLEDKLLNITVDGAPQGGYLSHHHGQYVIEPELLKSVQIEPGPGGAMQGTGALGGSIRFVTKDADDFLQSGETFGSFNKASYFANGDAVKLTSTLYGRAGDNVSLLGAFTWFDTENYEDGNGDEVNYTAHTQKRGFVKGNIDVLDGQRLGVSVEQTQDKGVFRHRPNFGGFFTHPRASNVPVPMEISRDTVTLSYEQRPGDAVAGAGSTLYYTDYSIDRTGQYEMGYSSLGLDAHNRSTLGDHALVYGFDYRRDEMSFTGKGTSTTPILPITYRTIPDEKVRIVGAYAQDEWRATDRIQLSGGVRYDHYDYTDKDGKRFKDDGLSPNLGASFKVVEGLRLNASYGFAFRGVTVIDAITSNEGGTTNAVAIDPEIAGNGEVGFQYVRGPFSLAGTVYRQEIKDVIGGSSPRDNLGDLKTEGYDLTAAVTWGDFDASLAVSESDPELNGNNLVDTDFGLGSSYGRSWNAHAGYRLKPQRLSFGWSVNYVEEFDGAPAGASAAVRALFVKPSYVVHGAYVQWLPLPNERLVVTLTAVNLFDKYYVDQATSGYNSQLSRVAGLPESGRDVRASISYQF